MFQLLLLAFLQLGCAQNDFPFNLVATSIQPTSVSISYTVEPSQGTVGRANITTVYTGTCAGPVPSQMTILNGFSDTYTITNLQEYSRYSITVTLDLTFGRTGMRSVVVVTQGTTPSSVTNFRQIAATSDSITMAWDPISCLDRNSVIEQYSLNYRLLPSGFITIEANIVGLEASQFTIPSLVTASNYSIYLSVTFSLSPEDSPATATLSETIVGSTFLIPGPYDLELTPNVSSISLSWRQERTNRNMVRYDLSAEYVGSCTELLNTDPMTLTRIVALTGGGGGGRMMRIQQTFEGLVPHGSYMLTVTTVSRDGQTASASDNATTFNSIPAGPPLSLNEVTRGVFSLTVAWSPPRCEDQHGEILDYSIFYAPSRTYSNTSRVTLSRIMDTIVTIMGLEPSTTYSIQVAANNLEGLGPLHEVIQITTLDPFPPVTDLQTDSTTSTTAILTWTQLENVTYLVTVNYILPCTDISIAPQRSSLVGRSGESTYRLTGLEEHSTYLVEVRPSEATEVRTTLLSTAPSDPLIEDDYVSVREVNDTTITLEALPLPCIHKNTELVSLYGIRYSQVEGQNNSNVMSNMFSPGVVTIGNLLPGTNYSFEVIISTVDGREVTLQPIIGNTLGTPISSTKGPGPPVTTASTANVPTFAVIIVAIVIACIVVALTTILIVCCVSSCRRRAARKKKEEQSALNDMSRIAREMKERDTKKTTANPERNRKAEAREDKKYESGSKRVKIVAEEKASEKRKTEKKDSLRAKAQEKKKIKKKSLSRATSSGTENGPFPISSIGKSKNRPFSDLNWMNMMTQSTTVATENSDLLDWENIDGGHVDILTFNEADFEYNEGTATSKTSRAKEPTQTGKETTYKFEEQVMKNFVDSDEPEGSDRAEKGKGFQYVESSDFEDDLDFDDEEFYNGGLEYN